MKKIFSFLLAALMLVSAVPTALATNDYSAGTQVTYDATADNDGDGNPDSAEAYTVTVPALLAPGAEGNVVAQGTWASNRKLVVTADENVTLTNSINSNDQKVLDVTFAGIDLAGSNTAAVSDTKAVSVAGIEDALFGTWSGTFYYDVEMVDATLIGYNYNGHILPKVPDSEVTPYCYITINTNADEINMILDMMGLSEYAEQATGLYMANQISKPLARTDNKGTDILFANGGGITGGGLFIQGVDSEWRMMPTEDSGDSSTFLLGAAPLIWCNADILDADDDGNSIFREASPAAYPVYE